MSAPNRKGTSGSYTDGILLFSVVGLAAALLGGAWVSAHWGSSLAGIASLADGHHHTMHQGEDMGQPININITLTGDQANISGYATLTS